MKYKTIILLFAFSLVLNVIVSQVSPIVWWDEAVYSSLGYDLSSDPLTYGFSKWGDRNFDWVDKAGFRAPLLPYSLAAIFAGGGSYFATSLLIPIIGALGVVLIYLLTKKMFGEKVALYSALFLMLIPIHLRYSGKILADVLATTLITGTFYIFWLGFEKKDPKYKILTGFLAGLTILAKYATLFMLPIFLIYLLLRDRNVKFLKDRHLWIAALVFLLTLTPLLIYGQISYGNPLGAFIHGQKAASYWGSGSPWYFVISNAPAMFSIVSIFILIGFLTMIKKFKFKEHNKMLILLWFLIFMIFFSSLGHKEDRYFLPVVPAACIIAGLALGNMKKYQKQIFTGIMIILVAGAFYTIYNESGGGADDLNCFLDANEFLKNTEDNALIFTDSSPLVYHYTRKENHYFAQSVTELTDLIDEHYQDRPVYVLWTKYDKPTDLRQDLNKHSEFGIVYRCPENGELAVIYKH